MARRCLRWVVSVGAWKTWDRRKRGGYYITIRVLADTFQVPDEDVALFVEELQDNHVAGRPDTQYDVILRDDDPDDPLVLASAVAADADVLITGDSAFRAVIALYYKLVWAHKPTVK